MLYVQNGTTLFPLQHGGGQEFNIRSGTENVAGNVSFVKALRLIKEQENSQQAHLKSLASFLANHLKKINGVIINSPENHAPHIINVSIPGLKTKVVINALYNAGEVISTSSDFLCT